MRMRSARAFAAGLLVVGLLLALVPLVARAEDPPPPLRFDDLRLVPTGDPPRELHVGDFDEDGWPDLVHAADMDFDYAVYLHLNDHAGGFAAPIVLPFDLWPRSLAVADLDEDGHLDLAISTNTSPTAVTILGGDGSGGFVAHTVATPYLFDVRTIADLDGDGHLDLVGVMQYRIAVLLGDGTGAFPTLRISSPDFPPDRIALGDLNEDGVLDAVFTGNLEGWLGVMTGLGDGRFGDFRLAATGWRPVHTVIADLDEDGHEDVAVAVEGAPSVLVMRGDGAGGLASPVAPPNAPDTADFLLVSDWERDGHPDLAVVSERDPTLVLWRGDGAGGLETVRNLALAQGPIEIAVADVDRDGDRDTIVTLGSGRALAIVPGRGASGMFEPPAPLAAPDVQRSIATGDFDEDGHLDFAVGAVAGVHLYLGDGRGGFEPRLFAISQPRTTWLLQPADLNGDGHTDLVRIAAYGTPEIEVWLGDGEVGFTRISSESCGNVVTLAVGDFNGDLVPDVADMAEGFVRIRLNDGTGSLAAPIVLTLPATGHDFTIGDWNGDGFLDIAASINHPNMPIELLFGDGTGAFPQTVVLQNVPVLAAWLRALDLDADGDLDLVCSGGASYGDALWVLLGDGGGGFTYHGMYFAGTINHGLPAVGDFDEDGRVDLAIASTYYYRGASTIVRGDGAGGFLDHASIVLDPAYAVLAAMDFDEDGHLDLVMPSLRTERVSLHRNATFDALECRRGEVNAGAGPRADVLLIDGSPGEGPQRRLVYALGQSFEVRMELPPGAGGTARFALYAWNRAPYVGSVEVEPYRLGRACLPTPLGPSFLSPTVIWNNTGKPQLGVPTKQSSPAPTIVGVKAAGHGLMGSFFLQGIIEDPLSPSGKAAVTNGIELVFQ